jgi:hypothetical protein
LRRRAEKGFTTMQDIEEIKPGRKAAAPLPSLIKRLTSLVGVVALTMALSLSAPVSALADDNPQRDTYCDQQPGNLPAEECVVRYNAWQAALKALGGSTDLAAAASDWQSATALGTPMGYTAYVTGWGQGVDYIDYLITLYTRLIAFATKSLTDPSVPDAAEQIRVLTKSLAALNDARPTAVHNAQAASNRAAEVYATFTPRSGGVDVAPKSSDVTVADGSSKVVDGKAQVTIVVTRKWVNEYGGKITDTYPFAWVEGAGEFLVYAWPAAETTSMADVTATVADEAWTGHRIAPTVKVVAHGVALPSGYSWTEKYGTNRSIGIGTVTLTGLGSYTGTKVVTFRIVPKQPWITKIKVKKRAIAITWTRAAAAQKVSGYLVHYQKQGTGVWKSKYVSAKKASVTIKKLAKGRFYLIRVAAHKVVSKVRYISAWSTATSKAVK